MPKSAFNGNFPCTCWLTSSLLPSHWLKHSSGDTRSFACATFRGGKKDIVHHLSKNADKVSSHDRHRVNIQQICYWIFQTISSGGLVSSSTEIKLSFLHNTTIGFSHASIGLFWCSTCLRCLIRHSRLFPGENFSIEPQADLEAGPARKKVLSHWDIQRA